MEQHAKDAAVGSTRVKKKAGRSRRAGRRLILMTLYVAFLGYGVYQIAFVQQARLAELRGQQAQIRQNIQLETARNEELTRQYAEGNSDSVVERIAREKLGLVMPDEKIYMDASRN